MNRIFKAVSDPTNHRWMDSLYSGFVAGLRNTLALAVALLLVPHAPAQSDQAHFDQVREQVVQQITQILQTKAFSLSGNLSKWTSLDPEYAAAISNASDERTLLDAINRALGTLGVSHLRLLESRAAAGDAPRPLEVGIRTIRVEDGRLVTRVLTGGPAAAAEIRPGDVVISVDGMPAAAPRQFSGNEGETRSLVIRLADGTLRELDVPVARVPLYVSEVTNFWPIEVFHLDKDTVVIVCDSFDIGYAPPETTQLLESITAQNIIIDLRDNWGGPGFYVQHFIAHFIPPGTTLGANIDRESLSKFMHETGKTEDDLVEFVRWSPISWVTRNPFKLFPELRASTGREDIIQGRIGVLVSQDTASAGEIAAQHLREFAGAQIIGTRTGGRVLAASHAGLKNGFVLYYPSTDYVTATGYVLEGQGIVPDAEYAKPRRIAMDEADPAWIVARDHLLKQR